MKFKLSLNFQFLFSNFHDFFSYDVHLYSLTFFFFLFLHLFSFISFSTNIYSSLWFYFKYSSSLHYSFSLSLHFFTFFLDPLFIHFHVIFSFALLRIDLCSFLLILAQGHRNRAPCGNQCICPVIMSLQVHFLTNKPGWDIQSFLQFFSFFLISVISLDPFFFYTSSLFLHFIIYIRHFQFYILFFTSLSFLVPSPGLTFLNLFIIKPLLRSPSSTFDFS